MKKSNLRIFSIALVALLVITSSGLVLGAWYLRQLEDTVTEKFEGRKWVFPSKIYSDSYLLYVGINLRVEELTDKLRRLGYFETQGPPKAQGRIPRRRAAPWRFFSTISLFPPSSVEGVPVRLSLQGDDCCAHRKSRRPARICSISSSSLSW